MNVCLLGRSTVSSPIQIISTEKEPVKVLPNKVEPNKSPNLTYSICTYLALILLTCRKFHTNFVF